MVLYNEASYQSKAISTAWIKITTMLVRRGKNNLGRCTAHIYMYIIGIEVLNVNIYRMMYTATIKRSAENDIDTYG